MSNPGSDASAAVTQAEKQHGASSVYNKLQEEIYTEGTKLGVGSSGYNTYSDDVNKDLQKAGILPEMTDEWLANNKQALASNSNDGGNITKAGIQSYAQTAKEWTHLPKVDESQADFATDAANNFMSEAHTRQDNNFGWHHGAYLIGGSDISKDLQGQEQLQGMKGTMDLLTKGKDPNGVFSMLDTSANGGSADGKVAQSDIQAFVKDKGNNSTLLDMGYSQDQINQLKSGLSSIASNWNSPGVNDLRDNSGFLTADSIAKAYGYSGSSQDKFSQGFVDYAQGKDATSASSGTTDAGSTASDFSQLRANDTGDKADKAVETSVYDNYVKLSNPKPDDTWADVASRLLPSKSSQDEINALAKDFPKVKGLVGYPILGQPLTATQLYDLAQENSTFKSVLLKAQQDAAGQS